MTKKDTKHYIQKTLSKKKEAPTRIRFKKLDNVNNPRSIHGIYPYRGKMSALDAENIIAQLPWDGRLLDPFCGSGTVIYEAQKKGIESIGVDNNPLAVTVAKGKITPFDKIETINSLNDFISNAQSNKNAEEMSEYARKCFHPRTAKQIMSLKQYFEDMNEYLKAAFYGAIALAARGCNHYKWSSNSTGKIIEPHRKINFFSKLKNKVRKHMEFIEHNAPCEVFEHDSRDLRTMIPENSIDYVYTSPPYFDALDYTSYYARIIYSIMETDRGEIRDGLIQKFSTYEEDMYQVMKEIEYVTSNDALIIFVVGDKKTDDGIINGGDFFANLSEWKPSYIVEREYTGTSSQIWDSINETERKEQIVVWDRRNQ